jgi:hypothetical protein
MGLLSWIFEYFNRIVAPSKLFPRPLSKQERLMAPEVSQFVAETVDPLTAAGFDGDTVNWEDVDTVSGALAVILASFLRPNIDLDNYLDLGAPLYTIQRVVALAMNSALYEEELDRFNTPPGYVRLRNALADVDAPGPNHILVVDGGVPALHAAISNLASNRPHLFFFKETAGAPWSAMFVKSRSRTVIQPYVAEEDNFDDAGADNADPFEVDILDEGFDESVSEAPLREIGTKLEVWRGIAERTRGGLVKADLKRNSKCKIVSRKASSSAKERHSRPNDTGRLRMDQWREEVLDNDRSFPNRDAIMQRRYAMTGVDGL